MRWSPIWSDRTSDRKRTAWCASAAIPATPSGPLLGVFSPATTRVVLAAVQMMTVLPVYMNDQFGLGASFFGWVMTTNAGMVVLFQFPITRATERLPRLPL